MFVDCLDKTSIAKDKIVAVRILSHDVDDELFRVQAEVLSYPRNTRHNLFEGKLAACESFKKKFVGAAAAANGS